MTYKAWFKRETQEYENRLSQCCPNGMFEHEDVSEIERMTLKDWMSAFYPNLSFTGNKVIDQEIRHARRFWKENNNEESE
jgi:hypothetical protein